jgi:hypothetical protein
MPRTRISMQVLNDIFVALVAPKMMVWVYNSLLGLDDIFSDAV